MKVREGASVLRLISFLAGSLLAASTFAQTVVEVVVREYKYQPAEVRIKAGDTVKWMNEEKRVSHSVLFVGPGGFESERFFPGERWQRTFDKPGRYDYTCGPHPEMKGVVVVE